MLLHIFVFVLVAQISIQSEASVQFRLYANQNTSMAMPISTSNYGNFNYKRSLNYVILCHGFNEGATTLWFKDIITAFMKRPDYVVITSDYKDAVGLDYLAAVDKVSGIAVKIGKLIVKLQKNKGIPMNRFEIVGASLGAHVAGEAGLYVKNHVGVPVHRVFGLDPAAPGFEGTTKGFQRDAAKRTIAIHTSALGIQNRLAYFDFYPNGGLVQGSCGAMHFGDHYVATYYFACSINNDCNFVGKRCSSFGKYEKGCCKNNTQNPMGYGALYKKPSATYYLRTNCTPFGVFFN